MPKKLVFTYLGWILLFASIPNLLFVWALCGKHPPKRYSVVRENDDAARKKMKMYLRYRDKFDLIFIGDSKTQEGIDPQVIDRCLRDTYSYNIGSGPNWFDTQYAQLVDLLPNVPASTLVVWSIEDRNFVRINHMNTYIFYPIAPRLVPDYLKFGFSIARLWENLYSYNFLEPYADFLPGFFVLARRRDYYEEFEKMLKKDLRSFFASGEKTQQFSDQEILRYEQAQTLFKNGNPEVLAMEPVVIDGKIRGATVFKGRGNYVTVELDHPYFRERQRKEALKIKSQAKPWQYDPEYMAVFEGILGLFKKYKTRVIVNEMEQAPHMYSSPEDYRSRTAFMSKIRAIAESRDIPYVKVDYRIFSDDDFRDSIHFNERGVLKYNQLLAAQIQKARRDLSLKSSAFGHFKGSQS